MAGTKFSSKDYLAIAKANVVRAADVPMYPKLLIYARKKVGKTTFALSAGVENTLVIDPEEGSTYKKKSNPYIWRVSEWKQMQEVYGALRTGKLSPAVLGLGKSTTPFTWVVVDGLTRINNYALTFVRKVEEERDLDRQPGFVQQRDYGKSGDLMKQMLTQFHTLKMGVIYTAQEKMKTSAYDEDDSDAESSEYQLIPEIPDAVRGSVNSLVDVIGRLYVVRIEGKDDKKTAVRRLYVGTHERYDTGVRSEYVLPDIIKKPTVPRLIQLMKEGQAE
jgi:AAA domain